MHSGGEWPKLAPSNVTGYSKNDDKAGAAGRVMAITKEKKQEIIGAFGRAAQDTGSPEVQIALLTARRTGMSGHFKQHAKDHASRRGLLMMVSRRSSLLKYLRLQNRKSYLEVIGRLGIRK